MVVQHNLTAVNANRMLGLTTSSQAKSTERLSSGYKINRAADDAAGLAISEKMRKQVRGLTQATANAQDGISAVQTAEGALTEVHDMLQRMNELAIKAKNGTMSESDRQNVQDEMDQLVNEIDRVSTTTKFNEIYLLDGDASKGSEKVYEYKQYQEKAAAADLTSATTDEVQAVAKIAISNAQWDTGASLTVGGVTVSYSNENDKTKIHEKLNADANFQKKYVAEADGSNGLIIKSKEGTLTSDITKDAFATSLGVTGTPANSTSWSATGETDGEAGKITGTYYAEGSSTALTENEAYLLNKAGEQLYTSAPQKATLTDANGKSLTASEAKKLAEAGEVVKNGTTDVTASIDDYVKDTGKTINADLDISLHVGSDSGEKNTITMTIKQLSAIGVGVDGIDVKTADAAETAIDTISDAIKVVSDQRSLLGAVQNRLEHTVNNLSNVVENTTSAESQIRDTDMATEMVKYANNNILAQAGQAMLAQANQGNQGVLSLLG